MNEEKVKIKLNIAGESIVLSVPYSRQEETRKTEMEVNALFDTWRTRFPGKSDRELLAMIAYRYAERLAAVTREREETQSKIHSIGKRLESLVAVAPEPTAC